MTWIFSLTIFLVTWKVIFWKHKCITTQHKIYKSQKHNAISPSMFLSFSLQLFCSSPYEFLPLSVHLRLCLLSSLSTRPQRHFTFTSHYTVWDDESAVYLSVSIQCCSCLQVRRRRLDTHAHTHTHSITHALTRQANFISNRCAHKHFAQCVAVRSC